MNHVFRGWDEVALLLDREAKEQEQGSTAWLNTGQCASLRAIARRIKNNGLIIADEVGMGKTRIAVALAKCVQKAGGRVAILVPPGLGYQWEDELRTGGLTNIPPILRSLWAYLSAWDNGEGKTEKRPWFKENIVVLSHMFTHWRLSITSDYWRWSLLPEIFAQWRLKKYGRLPRYYYGNKVLKDPWTKNAGKSIIDAIPLTGDHPAKKFLNELDNQYVWRGELKENYIQGTALRKWLENAVGIGLGAFDLILVDEAHKARGEESGLSRILKNVILKTKEYRVVGLTATPVELDVAQWANTLSRIGLKKDLLDRIDNVIKDYVEAVKHLRQCWPPDEEILRTYRNASNRFKKELSPYVLRRDKREDKAVQLFQETTGEKLNRYRKESKLIIDAYNLTPKWQKAICAAEALSFASRLMDNSVAKRLRLTIGSGHGVAALLDQFQIDEVLDQKQLNYDQNDPIDGNSIHDQPLVVKGDGKRQQRAQWWINNITHLFKDGENSLYEHPAIIKAAKSIETSIIRKDKVLVFGRFTKPLRALVNLLNARAMLKALNSNEPWSQSKVHKDDYEDEWPAVRAAHTQLQSSISLENLDSILSKQYSRLDNIRSQFRGKLVDKTRKGFTQHGIRDNDKYFKAFEAFSRATELRDGDDLQIVSRAFLELLPSENTSDIGSFEPRTLAQTFCELMKSAIDRDDPDPDKDGDGSIDEQEADNLWETVKVRLKDEYGRTQGSFARLLYGGTSIHSRRLIQLAFNRKGSMPKVLVAQSMVGREGLNLHKACRTVLMLHPEWNPGVAEQQIGRVDRVDSYWSEELHKAILAKKHNDDIPRIIIQPVIFKGTYDEYNWNVLRERWDDLRAQLHGVVVPARLVENDEKSEAILKEISNCCPSFSPLTESL